MKTHMMQFRVTEEEKTLIEKCAKRTDLTVSEYIRAGMLMNMVIDGEPQAMKIVGKAIGLKAYDVLRKKLQPVEALGEGKA